MSEMKGKKTKKSKAIELVLCVTVGPLGIHRLYAGKYYSGAIMFILGLSWFLWVSNKFQNLTNASSAVAQYEMLSGNLISSTWDLIMVWVTIILLIWTLIDLILISRSKEG